MTQLCLQERVASFLAVFGQKAKGQSEADPKTQSLEIAS